jgi:hypothetical protein
MKKFNIKPYIHEVVVKKIYMSGRIYGNDILKINDAYLKERVLAGITKVASFSLSTGCPTKASAAHTVMRAFTDLLGLKNFTGVEVKGLSGGAVATTAPVVAPVEEKGKGKDAGKGKKEKVPEPEPEEDDELGGGMGDLFG